MVEKTIFPFEFGSLSSGGMVSFGDCRVKLGRRNASRWGFGEATDPCRFNLPFGGLDVILPFKDGINGLHVAENKNANGILVKRSSLNGGAKW